MNKGQELRWWRGVGLRMVRRLSVSAGVILISLSVFLTGEVFVRWAFNRPWPGAYEVMQIGFVFVTFFALAQTHALGRQIKVDILVKRFKGKASYVFQTIADTLLFIFVVIIGWYSALACFHAWHYNLYHVGNIEIPMVIPWITITMGTFITAGVALKELILNTRAFFSGH